MGTFKFGKRPASHDPRDLQYAVLRPNGQLPGVPAVFGHGNDYLGDAWLMLGNGPDDTVAPGFEGCGDCAWAGPAHETMELCHNAGRPAPPFTGKVVVEQYGEYCGYDPVTGENDQGSDVREVLNWRRTKGLRDTDGNIHKIAAYVALEPKNLQHIIEACYLFEAVGIGFEVPESAEQQFSGGEPWSVVHGAQIVGGHYVPVVGRPATGELACITWAKRQVMTDEFFETYCDESWAYVTVERINTVTGKSYEHVGPAQLEEYLQMVTG
jgi:hypothetical protein